MAGEESSKRSKAAHDKGKAKKTKLQVMRRGGRAGRGAAVRGRGGGRGPVPMPAHGNVPQIGPLEMENPRQDPNHPRCCVNYKKNAAEALRKRKEDCYKYERVSFDTRF